MTNVTALKASNDAPKADEAMLPEFEIGIAMNLSGERQLTIRSPVKEQISRAEANRRMDALMHVAERQRSLQEITFLEEQFAAKTDALKLWQRRKDEADEKHDSDLAAVETAIADAMKKQEQLQQAAYSEARAAGRTADVKLTGNRLKDFNALDRAIGQHRDSVSTKEAEHEQRVMGPINGNIEKLEAELREIGRQLERHRTIVSG